MQLKMCSFTYLTAVFCLIFVHTVAGDCVIGINSLYDDSPIIVSALTRTFLQLHNSPTGQLTVPDGSLLTFICPTSDLHINYFKNFPKNNELLVKCAEGNKFLVNKDNNTYSLDYLYCGLPLVPSILNTNTTCHGPHDIRSTHTPRTTRVLVGYKTDYDFLTVYEVCFDKKLTGLVYALHTITPDIQKRQLRATKVWWYTDGDLFQRVNVDPDYLCQSQANTFLRILSRNYFDGSCCFSKTKIVEDQDTVFLSQRIATFHNLNTIPVCEMPNLGMIQQQIRALAFDLNRPLNVWTGVHKILQSPSAQSILHKDMFIHYKNDIDKAIPIPLFIWKVVYEADSEQAAVIIVINDHKAHQHVAEQMVLCPDICDKLTWLHLPHRLDFRWGYTYCCEIDTFTRVLNYTNNPFPKSIAGLLNLPEPTETIKF